MENLVFTSAAELARQIRDGTISPITVVDEHLERIDDRNDRTNAYVTVIEEEARAAAAAAERAIDAGDDVGPLCGVPVAIKDLSPVAGVRTTYGSVPLREFVPKTDSPVVSRLREAGAIILGKTNTSEFGHIATTDNDLFGATATPFNPQKTAGGSSGGSGAAVADGLAALAVGTDAGGSIRVPAAFCSVYGLKPTFGRVPRRTRPDAFIDTLPFWSGGPLARTVEDAALTLDVITGFDDHDPFSTPTSITYRDALSDSVDNLTVAYSPEFSVFPVDSAVKSVVDDAVQVLSATGMTVERVDPEIHDVWEEMSRAARVIFQARVAQVMETSDDAFGVDLRAHEDQLTFSFQRMGELGREFSAIDLGKANAVRTTVFDVIQELFEAYDLIATPTTGVPPFDLDRIGPDSIDGQPVDKYTDWYLTLPFNLTGGPAASVPAGFVDGLPVGLQLAGNRHADDIVVAASAAFERESSWANAYPP